ncbi:MAG: hypothetical protein WBO57_05835 [Gammaproteobacteria bacterium]
MTITSGVARAGKTHLGINLALELVRCGKRVGLFHDTTPATPISRLLASLPAPTCMHRRLTDITTDNEILRTGYQGVDILSCRAPLCHWSGVDRKEVDNLAASLEVQGGYDDILIDTSGMSPHPVLACCLASALVILVVTPEGRSQSEAFALLRLLLLNGFDKGITLVINRAGTSEDIAAIRDGFMAKVKESLGLDLPLLGVLPDDTHLVQAEHAGQAFSSIFPDAVISAALVKLAQALDGVELPQAQAGQSLADFLDALFEKTRIPMRLTGGAELPPRQPGHDLPLPSEEQPDSAHATATVVTLLQFDGLVSELDEVLEGVPADLYTLVDGITEIRMQQEGSRKDAMATDIRRHLDDGQLMEAAALLLKMIGTADAHPAQIQLQVDETVIQDDTPGWLRAGRYLKFQMHTQDDEGVFETIRQSLDGIESVRQDTGLNDEIIWEVVTPARQSCLHVICIPGEGVRIQVWLAVNDAKTTRRAGNWSSGRHQASG